MGLTLGSLRCGVYVIYSIRIIPVITLNSIQIFLIFPHLAPPSHHPTQLISTLHPVLSLSPHLQMLKQNNALIANRTQLVMLCQMGPKVFFNCAGFIKIDTAAMDNTTDSYVEVCCHSYRCCYCCHESCYHG